jgi:uncharacterized integral membrane protein
MTAVRLLVATAGVLLLLLAALSNAEPVTLRFLRLDAFEAPLAFVIFAAFAAGVAAGLLAGAWRHARLRRALTRLRRELRAAGVRPGPHGAVPAERREPPLDAL